MCAEILNPPPATVHPGLLRRRSVLKGAAVLGGAALLTACGGSGSSSPATTNPRGITVKDQRGKTVVFDKPVTRVVTLPMPAASMLIAVDQSAEHLVGMHDASWTAVRDGILGTIFPAALKVTHDVGDQEFVPNVESIVALEPDVVIQWGDRGSGIIAPMENAGLTVLGLSYGTQDDVATWTRLFATMLDKPQRAEAIISNIDDQLGEMTSLGDSRPSTGPSILYFFQITESINVAGSNSYNDSYINLVGGTNPAADVEGPSGIVGVDAEQVLAWDPDIILIGNFDVAMPADVYDDPVWQNLTAVKARRVYKVPLGGYRWDPPGQESPLMWRWLSDIAFPAGKGAALRSQVVTDYQLLYDYQPSDAQLDMILRIDANRESANYLQFDAT